MDSYLQTFIGVAVSIFLFMLGYRQTIGAKRERVKSANNEIEKILLRRIVLEEYKPSINDITRLIEGKARDYRIRPNDLLSPIQFLNTLFTRMVESDFMSPNQREKILGRINPVLVSAEEKPTESELIISDSSNEKFRVRIVGLTWLTLITSLIGAFATYSMIRKSDTILLSYPVVLLVFGISILIISLIIYFQRIKESQEEPAPSPINSLAKYESEVVKMLSELNLSWKTPIDGKDPGYDFLLEHNGKKIIIEVKAWSKIPPLNYMRHIINRLQNAMKKVQADEAIILTKENLDYPPEMFKSMNVKIMSLKYFRNIIMHK
jgi:hypothetical protein